MDVQANKGYKGWLIPIASTFNCSRNHSQNWSLYIKNALYHVETSGLDKTTIDNLIRLIRLFELAQDDDGRMKVIDNNPDSFKVDYKEDNTIDYIYFFIPIVKN